MYQTRIKNVIPVLWIGFLSACGGEGGSVASTPASPNYPTLASGTATLSTSASVEQFSRIGNASVPTIQSSSANLSISYNAATQTYTVSGNVTPGSSQITNASYGPAQLDTTGGARGSYNATTVNNGTTTVSRLQLSLDTRLTYSDIGSWATGATLPNGDQNFNTTYFSYGVLTQSSDMPRSGSANYSLSLWGSNTVQGTGTLNANFGNGSLSISLSPEYVYPHGTSSFGPITGNGTISAANSSFTATVANSSYTGTVNGLFYGPQAAEAGGSFVINSINNGSVVTVGAFSGKKN